MPQNGFAAVHHAAAGGHAEALKVLIACGADVNLPGPERKSALGLAAEHGHAECVGCLLKAKVCPHPATASWFDDHAH